MKKIFTLFVALFAMIFFANAQYLLNENFDNGIPSTWTTVDADGDDYNWVPSSSFGSGISGHNGSAGCAISQSYDNDFGPLEPDNWLITPQINLTVDATLKFWVCGQDASYQSEHYGVYISTTTADVAAFTTQLFEGTVGQTRAQGAWEQHTVDLSNYTGQQVYIAFRHYDITDMFYLDLDDVEVSAQPTSATIVAVNTNLDFGTVIVGNSEIRSTTIEGYVLTADITATTTAPFEVSANGTTGWGTTTTINQNGGTLYVRYTPTAGVADNGMVTLSSTGATNVSITLTGEGLDCSNIALPYTCNFSSEAEVACWTVVDVDGDGEDEYGQGQFNFNFTYGYAYYMYSGENPGNDWLISPAVQVGANTVASFDYAVGSWNGTVYPEKFSVHVIPAGQTYEDAIVVVPTQEVNNSSETETQTVDLSAYAGQTIQVAIKCESDPDKLALYIMNFNISNGTSVKEVENTVSVYPNPANNVINVNASSNISKVEVYSISGQKVGDFTANGTTTSINTSNLSAGLYMMRINTENGVVNQKFSVAR